MTHRFAKFNDNPVSTAPWHWCCRALAVCIVGVTGCPGIPSEPSTVFRSAPRVTIGSEQPTAVANLGALGLLDSGDALTISVTGENARTALIVVAENATGETGLVVGGALANVPFTFRARESGEFFVFVLYEPSTGADAQSATVTAAIAENVADNSVARQLVLIEFEDGFLTEPGLWDPVDGTPEDLDFLIALEPSVRAEVLRSLRQIFDGTPIELLDTPPTDTTEPYSTLTYSAQRVLGDQSDANDSALPPPDPTRPECQVRVVFGEVLPRGTIVDPGNRVRDDEAVVYVGSFQGRGQSCWTSAVGSLNNVVLTLTQTGAHEIGHLVGLYHVEQIDIMNRSATLAFLRNLEFARGQIQVDRIINGELVSEVFPPIVQEPQRYFDAIFAVDP